MKVSVRELCMTGLAAIALTVVGTAPAHAGQDSITFNNSNNSTSVTIYVDGVQEGTSAGEYDFTINGADVKAYCTDVHDNIYGGEAWKATETTAEDPHFGASTVWYANASHASGLTSAQTVSAVDWIAMTYQAPPAQEDAQLAIWDLTQASPGMTGITSTGGQNPQYSWANQSSFYVGGLSQQEMGTIYGIEHAALTAAANNNNGTFNSIFENAANGTQNAGYGRPQDVIYYNGGNFGPNFVPEFGTLASFGGMIATSGLALLRRRRRAA